MIHALYTLTVFFGFLFIAWRCAVATREMDEAKDRSIEGSS